jgi:uncharacterized repeat protein (TIGR03803 family)
MHRFPLTLLALFAPIVADASPTETILHRFSALPRYGQTGAADAGQPMSGLVLNTTGILAGHLYGTAESGGANCGSNGPGCGSVFVVKPVAPGRAKYTEAVISRFADNAAGGYPIGGLIIGAGGVMYGATSGGGIGGSGAGYGVVFRLTPPTTTSGNWTRNELYHFKGGTDGANPYGRLLLGTDGTLYGTTSTGGSGSVGTVFALTPPAGGKKTWSKNTLYSFSRADGDKPQGGLILTAGGMLAGVTTYGGASGFGVVFGLTPPAVVGGSWTEATLYDFPPYTNGIFPGAVDLIADAGGALYGTTIQGGTSGVGTVFKLSPPANNQTGWTIGVLYNFAGGSDGAEPAAGLTADAKGALYGTTQQGGTSNLGTVFKLQPPAKGSTSWTETVLHSFAGGTDGSVPLSALVVDPSGVIFGTTSQGGGNCPQWTDNGCGTVFKISQ